MDKILEKLENIENKLVSIEKELAWNKKQWENSESFAAYMKP